MNGNVTPPDPSVIPKVMVRVIVINAQCYFGLSCHVNMIWLMLMLIDCINSRIAGLTSTFHP